MAQNTPCPNCGSRNPKKCTFCGKVSNAPDNQVCSHCASPWDKTCTFCKKVADGTGPTGAEARRFPRTQYREEQSANTTKCKKCGTVSTFGYDGWCKKCWEQDEDTDYKEIHVREAAGGHNSTQGWPSKETAEYWAKKVRTYDDREITVVQDGKWWRIHYGPELTESQAYPTFTRLINEDTPLDRVVKTTHGFDKERRVIFQCPGALSLEDVREISPKVVRIEIHGNELSDIQNDDEMYGYPGWTGFNLYKDRDVDYKIRTMARMGIPAIRYVSQYVGMIGIRVPLKYMRRAGKYLYGGGNDTNVRGRLMPAAY